MSAEFPSEKQSTTRFTKATPDYLSPPQDDFYKAITEGVNSCEVRSDLEGTALYIIFRLIRTWKTSV
ncbi:hypothetical protein OBV_43400 [Oscillibacter valericigenes Sjm18-20]|nr:hypothetical protein OBV_43400 [Oscillibacter valericigenes Sjm18-20]